MQQALKAEFGSEAAAGVPFEKVVELAERHGYTMLAQEVEGELEESELDAVSGGAFDAFLKIDGIDGERFSLYQSPLKSTSRLDFGSNLFLKIDG